jgi:DNA-binding NarL/FixJ family response regulator
MTATEQTPIRIAFVEDNRNLRNRLAERFSFFDSIELVCGAGSGEEFLKRMTELDADHLPGVVLMDIELPGISGIETTLIIQDRWPKMDVLVLTVFEDEDKIFEAVKAGASGYLLKDTAVEKIVDAISDLVKGGAPMSPSVARSMLNYVQSGSASGSAGVTSAEGKKNASGSGLSAREYEILEHLVAGKTEVVIADELHISPNTVRTHIKSIYRKLHVHSRASAVREAFKRKLL